MTVLISLPPCLLNTTKSQCLCGNITGFADADLRTPEDEGFVATNLGWSWRVPHQEAQCAADCGDACLSLFWTATGDILSIIGFHFLTIFGPHNIHLMCAVKSLVSVKSLQWWAYLPCAPVHKRFCAGSWRPVLVHAKTHRSKLESGGTAFCCKLIIYVHLHLSHSPSLKTCHMEVDSVFLW